MTFASDAQRKWWFANVGSGSSGGSVGGGGGGLPAAPRDQTYRDNRIAYAQAMFPDFSEPDALRLLNDREGFGGLK